ncbi:COQ9 family protein [Niveispirillum irakense]|uniref:COQ9 family protein n=1 Tax=Niveispirillum irakense TaxID=34011 RepID=UPI000423811D|nr:COQ9 family protein [Niveispirillum irakense]
MQNMTETGDGAAQAAAPGPELTTDPLAEMEAELEARRDAILLGMLPDVAFDGWTLAAMRQGAKLAGFDAREAQAAFPEGPLQVLDHFADWADRQMLADLAATDMAALKVRQRVALAVRTRLEILAPYREALRRATAMLAMPSGLSLGPRLLYRTVDRVWRLAGDTSTDYNFYTKRLLLGGVVTTTTLYWLDDASDDQADSWAFLDRRINDVMTVGKSMGQVTGAVGKAGGLLAHLPSPARFARHLRGAMAR